MTAADDAFLAKAKTSAFGGSMSTIPIPSINGGDAAPSSAFNSSQAKFGNVLANASSGNGLWFSIAIIVGVIIWHKRTKK
jgi:hypothetical protein